MRCFLVFGHPNFILCNTCERIESFSVSVLTLLADSGSNLSALLEYLQQVQLLESIQIQSQFLRVVITNSQHFHVLLLAYKR